MADRTPGGPAFVTISNLEKAHTQFPSNIPGKFQSDRTGGRREIAGTDNSVVTLLEQRLELVTGRSFDLTTIVPIGHPRRIGLFAKLDLPKYLRG